MKYAPPRLWGITAVVTVVCVLGVITDIAVVQCREDDLLLTDRQRGPPTPHGRNHVGPRDTRRSTNDRATPRDDEDGVSSPPSAAPPPPADVYREDADGPTPTTATSRQQMVDPTCPIPEQQSEMNSFLWRISHPASPNTRPSYMFGTIHVPYARVWDHIPDNTKEALDEADAVYFELDLTNPHTIAMLANCQMLPAGEELHNILPPDLYRRLKRHLKYVKQEMPHWVTSAQQGHGLYADYMFNALTSNWQRKRPVWVMLMVNSLTENDVKSRGIPVLDLYLAQEAARLGKRTGSLERVEEQCLPLNALNLSQVVFALNKTLSQHETYRRGGQWTSVGTEQLIYHYNCGDLNEVIFSHDTARVPNLLNFTLSYNDTVIARKIDQYFRKELIYKRNRRIASRVDDLMQIHHNETYVFACGAGHFIGNNTVLDNLVNLGYTIEHIAAGQPLHPGSSKQKKKGSNSFRHGLPSAPIIISGDLDRIDPFYNRRKNRHRKNRHRGRNKKGRRRNRGGTHTGGGAPREAQGGPLNGPTDSDRLSRPQFNELWVRIEASSFGPNSYFRHRLSPAPPLFPGLDAGMTPFPPHLAPGGSGIVGGREDQSPSVSDGSHVDSSAPHNNMLSSAASSSSSRDLAASSVLSALCATCLLVLYVVAWKLAHR